MTFSGSNRLENDFWRPEQPPRGQRPQFFFTTVHIIVCSWVNNPLMPLLSMSHMLKWLFLAQTDWKVTFGGQNSLQEVRDLNSSPLLCIYMLVHDTGYLKWPLKLCPSIIPEIIRQKRLFFDFGGQGSLEMARNRLFVVIVTGYDALMELLGWKSMKIFINNLQFTSSEIFTFWRPEARDGPGR